MTTNTTAQLADAVQRVRDLHSNEDGICRWCKGPDDPNISWDMEYWPCATFRATLPDTNDGEPEVFEVGGRWFWHCPGGQGCNGWTGDDMRSEDAARRGYSRHFEEMHVRPLAAVDQEDAA